MGGFMKIWDSKSCINAWRRDNAYFIIKIAVIYYRNIRAVAGPKF